MEDKSTAILTSPCDHCTYALLMSATPIRCVRSISNNKTHQYQQSRDGFEKRGRICYQCCHLSAELYPHFHEQHMVVTTVHIGGSYCTLTCHKGNQALYLLSRLLVYFIL